MDALSIISLIAFLALGFVLVRFVINHMKKNNDPFLDKIKRK